MSPIATVQSATRAALLAALFLAPMPAMAQTLGESLQLEAPQQGGAEGQGDPSNLGEPSTQGDFVTEGGDPNDLRRQRRGNEFGRRDDFFFWCLDNSQIRRGLRRVGFEDIDFVRELRNDRVSVEAFYEPDGWVYSMRVDRCSGRVDRIMPLYEYDDFGFTLKFDY